MNRTICSCRLFDVEILEFLKTKLGDDITDQSVLIGADHDIRTGLIDFYLHDPKYYRDKEGKSYAPKSGYTIMTISKKLA